MEKRLRTAGVSNRTKLNWMSYQQRRQYLTTDH